MLNEYAGECFGIDVERDGSSGGESARESRYIDAFLNQRVDGLILVGVTDTANLRILEAQDFPVVVLDREAADCNVRAVFSDHYRGALEAVGYLISLGHREIGIISGPQDLNVSIERIRGWSDALLHNGLTPDRGKAVFAPFTAQGGYLATHELLARAPISAIFVSTDIQAAGLLRACREAGVFIPSDLSVVTFDGSDMAEFSAPPLTSVTQNVEQLAALAVTSVLDPECGGAGKGENVRESERVDGGARQGGRVRESGSDQGGDVSQPRAMIVPTRLTVRESTKEI
ncbi:MAG: substrate-binding domain-containing protein [Actinomycetaceae bacterium]|nr:substrate-binding domain-containing protein [Actinomycetaceae bacterium]MDY5854245.1 substrate-binding domain-containing protein [Arcanobacterium sp.]